MCLSSFQYETHEIQKVGGWWVRDPQSKSVPTPLPQPRRPHALSRDPRALSRRPAQQARACCIKRESMRNKVCHTATDTQQYLDGGFTGNSSLCSSLLYTKEKQRNHLDKRTKNHKWLALSGMVVEANSCKHEIQIHEMHAPARTFAATSASARAFSRSARAFSAAYV